MRRALIPLAAMVVAAAVLAGIVTAVVELRGDDEASRTRAFFTLPTPSSCATSDLAISVEGSHLSAFVPGSGLKSIQGKFLTVTFTASSRTLPAASDLASRFFLAEASGRRYTPVSDPGGSTPAAGPSPRRQELVFDVPQALAAAKLTFDDGCLHQEWIAP